MSPVRIYSFSFYLKAINLSRKYKNIEFCENMANIHELTQIAYTFILLSKKKKKKKKIELNCSLGLILYFCK